MKQRFFKLIALFCSLIFAFNGLGLFQAKLLADVNRTAIEEFVERGYSEILDRESDEAGLDFWSNGIINGTLNASELVVCFIESPEFISRNFSFEEVVNTIYRVMLSREAEEAGLIYWTGILSDGLSIRYIVNGFSDSPEFGSLCASYGISTGNVPYVEPRDMNPLTTKFVSRIYVNAFGETPDASSLNYWADCFNQRTAYPEDLISALIFSDYFEATTTENIDFINTLYKIAFGTEGDSRSISFWLDFLNTNSRQDLINAFTNSEEFIATIGFFDLRLRPTNTPTPTPRPSRMVALTFDDGPYSPVTTRILDLLEEVDGHATFFVVGDRVNRYSDCVIRASNMGCEIANHTYDHKSTLTRMSASEVRTEIRDCNSAVHEVLGYNPVIMRPVGGAYNETVAANVDMPMIIWSLDTQDWRIRRADSIVSAILNNVSDGDIILMHDLYPSTADAMEIVIPELVRRGYALVTVSELAEARGIDLSAGTAYYSIRP